MDEELKRIEEEIRKAKERRQALEDRKNRRMKQIAVLPVKRTVNN